METELVTVSVAGGQYTSWKEVSIRAAVNEACRSYTLRCAAPADGVTPTPFQNFMPVTISASPLSAGAPPGGGGGDLMFTGYIDRRRPMIDPETAEITISGRSKGQDSVDCSALHDTGFFQNQTPLQIAQAIDQYGTNYTSDAQLDPIDQHQLTPGETVHREVERLCRDQALSLFGQADGSVKLWNADTSLQRNAGVLGEGIYPFKKGEADHNCENRHSHVHVRGQTSKGTGKSVHQIEAIAQDSGVTRTRHVLHVHDDNTDSKRVQKRAEHRRDRAAGNGLKATVTVQGWRDQGGTLWTPGFRVFVQSAFLDIQQDMLIEAVTYRQKDAEGDGGEGGTTAELELVDPRAYSGNSGQASKSGSEWNVDSSDATVTD